MKKLIAGNWKMNGVAASIQEVTKLAGALTAKDLENADVLVCPPATLIHPVIEAANGTSVMVGGQNCHASEKGAHTGELSAEMFADLGASHLIVGHSERRAEFGETNEQVRQKAEAAQRAGLVPIICVGESLAVRKAGDAVSTVLAQLEGSLPTQGGHFAVAYEPVWAIGTGESAAPEDILEMHQALRSAVGDGVHLLYGGSVKAKNANEILTLENVDGALVGGASLTADDFHGIISAI